MATPVVAIATSFGQLMHDILHSGDIAMVTPTCSNVVSSEKKHHMFFCDINAEIWLSGELKYYHGSGCCHGNRWSYINYRKFFGNLSGICIIVW